MGHPLATHDGVLVAGRAVSRPNRFVLEVSFGGAPERVYLPDPGELAFLEAGSVVHCSPVDDPSRKTAYDAVAVELDGFHVSLKPAFANALVRQALASDLLPAFDGYELVSTEPAYPGHGRADLLLAPPTGDRDVFVEVKSCTHAEAGVAKFPDRPTERGRRHVASLADIAAGGGEAHLVFVAQRPDVEAIAPFAAVDPAFAEALAGAAAAGVGIHGLVTEFAPPAYRLLETDVPVRLD